MDEQEDMKRKASDAFEMMMKRAHEMSEACAIPKVEAFILVTMGVVSSIAACLDIEIEDVKVVRAPRDYQPLFDESLESLRKVVENSKVGSFGERAGMIAMAALAHYAAYNGHVLSVGTFLRH